VKASIALLRSEPSKLLDPPKVEVDIVQVEEVPVLVELAAACCIHVGQ
jgi:hypothetical protein